LHFRFHKHFVHHLITQLLALLIKNNFRVGMKLLPVKSRIHCLKE
jgi:hypothetical protein